MCRLDSSIVDKIAEKSIEVFQNLPKTGKPNENEWTVLSSIIQYESLTGNYNVVALGTGSKCIGATKMSPTGNILNDSHAEVVARRGFLLYLYNNIEQCLDREDSIFVFKESCCVLKPGIDFVFYSSQLPCGDASIIPKGDNNDDQVGDIICETKRAGGEDVNEHLSKKPRLHDIHRTGAKCLENSEQDPKLPGAEYHLLGKVRTKPGRGDRTLSVSCSDKIARWIHLGIQGSLLDMLLLEPIYIKHFIFGAGVPYSEECLNRAFFTRHQEKQELMHLPYIYQCKIQFTYLKSEKNIKPAASSIIYVNIHNRIYEAAIQGKKQGVTKKNEKLTSNYLSICKFSLYSRFKSILQKNEVWKQRICDEDSLQNIPYNIMKFKSKRYMANWKALRESFFKSWTKKPDLFVFT